MDFSLSQTHQPQKGPGILHRVCINVLLRSRNQKHYHSNKCFLLIWWYTQYSALRNECKSLPFFPVELQSYCLTQQILYLQFIDFQSDFPVMQKVASKLSNQLLCVSKLQFSRMMMDAASNPIKDRVVSTAQWPVPYYQRISKAYPVRQQKKINLSAAPHGASDLNWWSAKNMLNQELKGRQLVEHTENNIKTNTFLIRREDCEVMARAYVQDISQFLNLANRENVRILSGKTLI